MVMPAGLLQCSRTFPDVRLDNCLPNQNRIMNKTSEKYLLSKKMALHSTNKGSSRKFSSKRENRRNRDQINKYGEKPLTTRHLKQLTALPLISPSKSIVLQNNSHSSRKEKKIDNSKNQQYAKEDICVKKEKKKELEAKKTKPKPEDKDCLTSSCNMKVTTKKKR